MGWIIAGLIVATAMEAVFVYGIDSLYLKGTSEVVAYILSVILALAIGTSVTIGCIICRSVLERQFILKYNTQMEVYEEALEDDDLGGLERLDIIKNIADLKGEYAERKFVTEQWFWLGDKDIYK